MMTLDFTLEELDILNEVLLICTEDLRAEIMHTDRLEYKQMLQHREALLKKMRAAVLAAQQDASMPA